MENSNISLVEFSLHANSPQGQFGRVFHLTKAISPAGFKLGWRSSCLALTPGHIPFSRSFPLQTTKSWKLPAIAAGISPPSLTPNIFSELSTSFLLERGRPDII